MQRGALPDLNTFLLVAEHLSFRVAAEQLNLTAPAGSGFVGSRRDRYRSGLHFDDPRYAEADHKLDVAGEEQDKVWLQRLTTRARLCFTLGTFS